MGISGGGPPISSAPNDHTPGNRGGAASFLCIPRGVAVFDSQPGGQP